MNTCADKEEVTSSACSLAADKDEESQSPLLGVTASPPSSAVPASSLHYNRAIINLRKTIEGVGAAEGGGVVGAFQDIIIGTILATILATLTFLLLNFVGIIHTQLQHILLVNVIGALLAALNILLCRCLGLGLGMLLMSLGLGLGLWLSLTLNLTSLASYTTSFRSM